MRFVEQHQSQLQSILLCCLQILFVLDVGADWSDISNEICKVGDPDELDDDNQEHLDSRLSLHVTEAHGSEGLEDEVETYCIEVAGRPIIDF